MRLRGKVAIITGGANGIGRATALLFAREGAQVVVSDRDATAGEACAAAIRDQGSVAIFVAADATDDGQVAALVSAASKQFGGVDLLVNCAGIDVRGTVVDTDPARWQRVLDVNLASIHRSCRHAIPEMIRRGGGAIVNIASLQGMYGWPHYAAYAASKAGIIGLTRQIAVDYAAHNIRCNVISPGAVETALHDNTERLEPHLSGDPGVPATAGQEDPVTHSTAALAGGPSRNAWSGPIGRLGGPGRPEDIANAALFLVSDESTHISGHNLVVDGGASARVE
jgi:NAD(P)-dependent dehydrogenase (short-subunit alcohol dehydrogenase family)